MKTNADYTAEAISDHIGDVKIGDVVAHHSHRLAHSLIDIVEGIGACELPSGEINYFPTSELFDVNAVSFTAFYNKITDGLKVNRNN